MWKQLYLPILTNPLKGTYHACFSFSLCQTRMPVKHFCPQYKSLTSFIAPQSRSQSPYFQPFSKPCWNARTEDDPKVTLQRHSPLCSDWSVLSGVEPACPSSSTVFSGRLKAATAYWVPLQARAGNEWVWWGSFIPLLLDVFLGEGLGLTDITEEEVFYQISPIKRKVPRDVRTFEISRTSRNDLFSEASNLVLGYQKKYNISFFEN